MLETIENLSAQGRYEEALQSALGALASSPLNPQLLYNVASLYDCLGLEQQAIPFYQAAINHQLGGQDLRDAYLGLGSTYRALGRYQESLETFDTGLRLFPNASEIRMFRAMTLYNLGHAKEAVAQLLMLLMNSNSSQEIIRYKKAITFYSDDLDRIE